MKKLLPFLLLLATGCGSKNTDPAAKLADPDAVPAGQHLIKVVYTGSGWPAAAPSLFIFQSTSNTVGKEVYRNVTGNWSEAVDAGKERVLRLAYRDTTFALKFYAGMNPRPPGAAVAAAGATLTANAYVDGRLQWTNSINSGSTAGDKEWLLDTKNLK
jgi:hypothetical protein